MSFEYDPASSLRHWPTPMGRFGKNPFGENLYRIVLTESRRHLVGGLWPDGATGYHWVPKYRSVKAPWILERWRWEMLSKAKWDELVDPVSGWPLFGPYPTRGDYELVWEFDAGVDADSLDNIIGFVNRRDSWSFQDHRDRVAAEYQQEENDIRKAGRDEIRDCMTAFGGAPISYGRFGRGTKTQQDFATAQDMNLPIPRGRPQNLNGLEVTSSMFAGGV
jgi:hypothetical protein